ncbi:MAG: AFG1 family ATPase [Gammaproteobacteria bacterium]|nr:AFG1 family ATPase [Gammaproteobacteria bacterium]MBU1555250.1 AFG1 family ATPase [Gammaproteobacteria bacterium]MBU2068916.1 AFG1 family ATPase [Gammaproteobacteria bacterium]MBU2181422.1 AFG1 family ATPase [Gammaproteobacteria bacterium]MBU2203831.1 AFG1 family ATPase [Gammaproteobacteria bacterium]
MTPIEKYQQDLTRSDFHQDAAQAFAVSQLQRLYDDFVAKKDDKPSVISRLFGKSTQAKPLQGLYFWGGVGRGKTYLVDTFYECLPTSRKMRIHFHRFMHRVHEELKLLKGVSNPLEKVADSFKQETDILCFDEFFVSDITDAMILGTLMQALFARGITLVATSNIEPDGLYRNGLQRARFLPAIELIKQHSRIVNVDSGIDYRLRTLEQAEIYHFPLDQQADTNLQNYFNALSSEPRQQNTAIDVANRQIMARHEADGVVWFDFGQLCESARSQYDYMELSRLYHTVLLSGVKPMGRHNDDVARRFIALVDEFYERSVKLIISAEVKLELLYSEGILSFEFKRCISRLQEMQSHDYLAKPHLP